MKELTEPRPLSDVGMDYLSTIYIVLCKHLRLGKDIWIGVCGYNY